MNSNSVICRLIDENRDNWEQIMEDLLIKVKREGDLAIFNYDMFADFYNPVVKEARGIIIDISSLEVVCFPFTKFGNYNEGYVDSIDWDSARVLEKVDGSIVKLWYDKKFGDWRWSTNGMITPDENYAKLIKKAAQNSNLKYDMLNKDYTYIFELISPYNQIVIKYASTSLVHIGTRDNISCKELEVELGIRKPKQYDLKSEEDCLLFVKQLNAEAKVVEHEGFVVVDKDYHRVKIKSPEYFTWHRLISNKSMNKEYFLEMIINSKEIIDDFISLNPEYKEHMEYYIAEYNKMLVDIDNSIKAARLAYAESGYDRKSVALKIKDDKYNSFVFKALDKDSTAKEQVAVLSVSKIAKFIKDYVEN